MHSLLHKAQRHATVGPSDLSFKALGPFFHEGRAVYRKHDHFSEGKWKREDGLCLSAENNPVNSEFIGSEKNMVII